MAILVTFGLNAAVNFLLGLAIAAVLGPEEFGRFAVGSTVSIVLSTTLFEWLRLSVIRRYNNLSRQDDPTLRASLEAAYLCGAAIVILVVLLGGLAGVDVGLPPSLVAASVLASIATGRFELWMALARARFLNGFYAKLVIFKNLIAFVLMIGAARYFHDATAVLFALTASIAVLYGPARRALRDPHAVVSLWQRARVVGFASYGVPIVAANIIFQLIALVNRGVASSHFGFAEAGQLSFSTDVGTRLLVAVGAGLDVLLFQVAVRREVTHGKDAAHTQMARNMTLIAAALVPLAAGYAATLPAFSALFVPASYRADFATISLILIPGLLAYSVIQFIIGPVFQIDGGTRPMVHAAVAALVLDLALLALLPHAAGVAGIALAHTASFLLAVAVAAALAARAHAQWPPLRDLLGIVLATAVMTLIIWPARYVPQPWLAFCGAVALGVPIYAVLLAALNVADLRPELVARRFGPRAGSAADLLRHGGRQR